MENNLLINIEFDTSILVNYKEEKDLFLIMDNIKSNIFDFINENQKNISYKVLFELKE